MCRKKEKVERFSEKEKGQNMSIAPRSDDLQWLQALCLLRREQTQTSNLPFFDPDSLPISFPDKIDDSTFMRLLTAFSTGSDDGLLPHNHFT
ncbi:hypothetical protein CDAR_576541 [Caerostris darwini]|uniref:Uncharacterized protein n=1 Tax=Caerostris darwini TaxID=1538125 RepID=A0AAV4TH78_9ARAC|nr:hypothetical protein CDAR_576541 [Caerostris darwini]